MEVQRSENFTYQKRCAELFSFLIYEQIRNPSHTYVDYIDKILPTSTKITLNLTEMNELGCFFVEKYSKD